MPKAPSGWITWSRCRVRNEGLPAELYPAVPGVAQVPAARAGIEDVGAEQQVAGGVLLGRRQGRVVRPGELRVDAQRLGLRGLPLLQRLLELGDSSKGHVAGSTATSRSEL
ncbi:hypothetical protein GCM10010218_40170 [Streptomyces mashuensis]|uniref:Uncharacterized protein n=1 Tax=Streptomyces mashuensis TaxID=33904 RepID=A0A919B4W2_9ACTN|nr:hypothetical protein GCM10010218_40170 [Streptomyces mashuensis]